MAVQVVVERDNVNDETVIVRKIYKQSGMRVAADDPILEIETSKTVKEVRSPKSGFLILTIKEGDEIAVGGRLFDVDTNTEAMAHQAPDTIGDVKKADVGRVFSSAAEALAKELHVDHQLLPEGWITSQDVRAIATAGKSNAQGDGELRARQVARPVDKVIPKANFRPESMSLRKRTEVRNLARANSHGTTSIIGMDVLLPGARIASPPYLFEDSITDVVVFEAAKLVRHFPDLNAFCVDDRTIGYFEEVNFGISFDGGHDLKVLALRNADTLSLAQIQSGIQELLELYESKESIDDGLLSTSTITVSDLSRSSATFMMPLLNAEQSLLIGITSRDSRSYTLHAAFDHRVSEGLQVARFLEELRERVISHHRPSGVRHNSMNLRCSACDQTLETEAGHSRPWLVQVVLQDGSQGQLCRNCYDGW